MIDWNGIKIVETDCMLPIDRVKPYARNAKRHPQEQIDEIKASIKRFGMDDPIGIWGKENLIVEGHGRLEACKQLGIPTVPCIRARPSDEGRAQGVHPGAQQNQHGQRLGLYGA